MKFGDYYTVRDWLENFIPFTYSKENLGLERIEYLLRFLGNPQNKFKSIHVAGTSGKGSTTYYVAKLLQLSVLSSQSSTLRDEPSGHSTVSSDRIGSDSNELSDSSQSVSQLTGPVQAGVQPPHEATILGVEPRKNKSENRPASRGEQRKTDNWKIGLHLSPHLVDIRERMQINGRFIPMNQFIRLMTEIRPVVESMEGSKVGSPSYFEILVAASFLYFAQEKVDWAVVEVGLGGRLDATNVLKPEVSVITNVGLDHTEILGKTIEKIAYEKAGIIKEGTSVVTGILRLRSGLRLRGRSDSRRSSTTGRALRVIEKVVKEKKAPLVKVDAQLGVRPLKSDTKNHFSNYYDILRDSHGNFVFSNVLLAIEAVRTLGFRPSKEVITKAIRSGLPGRFEEIEPGVILDGAHNPDKIRFLIDFVRNSFHLSHSREGGNPDPRFREDDRMVGDIILVSGFKKGKNWQKMVDLLIKNLPIKKVVATEFQAVTDTGKFGVVSAQEVAAYVKSLRQGVSLTGVYSNSQEAVFEALRLRSGSSTLVLVTGSLYLVGEVRTMWQLPKI